jgi:cytochrome c biogenesis protein CcdA/thiol-disulfide isomerase/thioredoxin
MTLLLISFIAGVLTVLAPCILPLLPVIIGGSISEGKRDPWKAYVITGSLAVSVVLFTLLLKASTLFVSIPQSAWAVLSGVILLLIGVLMVFPGLWEKIALMVGLEKSSNKLLAKGFQKNSRAGDVLIGASLGPVFTTCSPTFFVILATVLPASFALGVFYIFAYAAGLSLALLVIALLGQRFMERLNIAADPRGWFKRGMGVLFILVGVAIMTGADKKLETIILDSGFFDVTKVEQRILDVTEDMDTAKEQESEGTPYVEIVDPSGFVNTEPFKLEDIVGEKVILLDIMTYSCINCQRTFPYLADWYDKYKDQGLEIVGIHTPEFALKRISAMLKMRWSVLGSTSQWCLITTTERGEHTAIVIGHGNI